MFNYPYLNRLYLRDADMSFNRRSSVDHKAQSGIQTGTHITVITKAFGDVKSAFSHHNFAVLSVIIYGFLVSTQVDLKTSIFWDITPKGLFRDQLRFRSLPWEYTASYPRIWNSSTAKLFLNLGRTNLMDTVLLKGRWQWPRSVSRMRPLGASETTPKWPILPHQDDRLWMWSSRWNENWQGKQKFSEKVWASVTLSTTNPTWPDLGSNLGRRCGKP
jgi:hypothetical protein